MSFSRRSFFSLSAFGISSMAANDWGQAPAPPSAYAISAADAFPQQDPALVRDAVGASHANLPRIRELVEKQPALAHASVDWGFGDWETCIDAASHVGNKPIAEFLLANGARPTIFSAAMLGQLDVVKAFITARPGIQKTHGPHSITLMAHPKAGGPDSAAVVEYLTGLGDADIAVPTQPLAADDRDAILGKYVYGPGPRDFFIVDVRTDRLGIERPNGPGRHVLAHSGNLVFFPTGAPSAKLAFLRENGRVTRLTLADPDVIVTAMRS